MKKLLFIFNPHAGTSKIANALSGVLNEFTKAGYDVTAYPTQSRGDGKRKIIADGAGYDRVVVAGGDGMLHELVDAVTRLPEPIAVGYIPAGTVNDFASTHRIPKDPEAAARLAVSDSLRTVDLGLFNDEYFSYVAAFGMVTQVAYETDQKAKNRLGRLAYLFDILKSIDLPHFQAACRPAVIEYGNDILTGDFVFGAVSNSLSIAGMDNFVGKDVVLDDGLLEGLFIRKPQTLLELEQLKKGLVEHNLEAPCLHHVQAESFTVRSEPVAWTLDGENGGTHEQAVISAVKHALVIALPPEER